MNKKKSRSYNQQELKHICDMLCANIENLLEALDINDYRMCDKMVICSCPIHGGDNSSALNLYHSGDFYRGNWTCHTQHCEHTFKGSIIGFVRGCLSNKQHNWQENGDDTVSFYDTIKFIKKFLNYKNNSKELLALKKSQEKNHFTRAINSLSESKQKNEQPKIGREIAIKTLDIPSAYFLNRGFSKDILEKYDVGECYNPQKEMYKRAVVPVYDESGDFLIGCSGRSIFQCCDSCNAYHDPAIKCPDKNDKYKFSKWKHSKNFKTENCLYNLWSSKKHIKSTSTVIIVESPGNVWSLESAGIFNSVAVFGSNLSHKQKAIIDMTGAMNIITIMDNDEAGSIASEKLYEKFHKTHNITNIKIPDQYNDLAELPSQEIIDTILPTLNRIIQ